MIKNSIPAFGGYTTSNILNKRPLGKDLKTVFSNNYLRIYDYAVPNKEQYYLINDDSFLWTGGFKGPQVLADFDYKKKDDKFIYLKFDASKLEIYTDHYSKIPLFYCWDNETLVFATSIELLLKIQGNRVINFDKNGLIFYYNFGFSNYQNHLIEGIQSVPGGQHLVFDFNTKKLNTKTYYNIFNIKDYSNNSNSLDENINSVDQVLFNSTRLTINHFDRLGIALSGGVDSGYLAQKINECGRKFNAYTLGFKDDYNEFERIDYLSKKLDFRTNKIVLDSEDIIENYLMVSKNSSFPVGFNNSILNIIYLNAKEDGIDIMFDGDGADRLFLGMNKYLQLKKILKLYSVSKKLNMNKFLALFLKMVSHQSASKLAFYFERFNHGYSFYGERKLSNNLKFNSDFESLLNNIALPKELKELGNNIDSWLFFSLFSVYYTPGFFFHTPYELQLKQNIVSNPQFWSDDMVNLALSIPVGQKLYKKTTKRVLRDAAKIKIDDGYWNLSKIGLQNSYNYIKQTKDGLDFINAYKHKIISSEEYLYLKQNLPNNNLDTERLLPYFIWKEQLLVSNSKFQY